MSALVEVNFGGLNVYDLRNRWAKRRAWKVRNLGTLEATVAHHTTGETPYLVLTALQFMDAISVYHQAYRNEDWPGAPRIAYTFCLDGHGRYYWCNDMDMRVWAQGPWNDKGLAIALLGTEPNAAQLEALAQLHVAAERVLERELILMGHREAMPGQTVCPTANWPALKPGVVARIEALTRPDQALIEAATPLLHALWALDERTHRGVIAIKQDLGFTA